MVLEGGTRIGSTPNKLYYSTVWLMTSFRTDEMVRTMIDPCKMIITRAMPLKVRS